MFFKKKKLKKGERFLLIEKKGISLFEYIGMEGCMQKAKLIDHEHQGPSEHLIGPNAMIIRCKGIVETISGEMIS